MRATIIFLELIKFNIRFIRYKFSVVKGAIICGNIKILKYLKRQEYMYKFIEWDLAVISQQLQVLKWAKNNGYKIPESIFSDAIKNKHLDILKFAYKNIYISKNIYQPATLNNSKS